MKISGKPHAPAALPMGKRPDTDLTGSWVEPTTAERFGVVKYAKKERNCTYFAKNALKFD